MQPLDVIPVQDQGQERAAGRRAEDLPRQLAESLGESYDQSGARGAGGIDMMKRSLFAAALMLSGVYATAQQASWNGSMDYVTTITGAQGVKCGYQYNGHEFSRVFRASNCPQVVAVETPSSARSTLADCQSIEPSLYRQCIQTAGPTPLSQCSVLPYDLHKVCIQRGGR